jgi:hypothetical protein
MKEIPLKSVNGYLWAETEYYFASTLRLEKNTRTKFINCSTDKNILVLQGLLVVELLIDNQLTRFVLEENDNWKINSKTAHAYEGAETCVFIEITQKEVWDDCTH